MPYVARKPNGHAKHYTPDAEPDISAIHGNSLAIFHHLIFLCAYHHFSLKKDKYKIHIIIQLIFLIN